MNNIHNIVCPGCDSPDYIKNMINGDVWHHWKCEGCGTKMNTLVETGEMSSYYMFAIHNGKMYEGAFFLRDNHFVLTHYQSEPEQPGNWDFIFKLHFLPKFNATTFAQKLPTLLLFS